MAFHWRGNLRGQEWLSKDKWLVRDCLICEGWYLCVETWVCNWEGGVYNGEGGAWEFHWLWEELSGITWVTWLWKKEAGKQYLRKQELFSLFCEENRMNLMDYLCFSCVLVLKDFRFWSKYIIILTNIQRFLLIACNFPLQPCISLSEESNRKILTSHSRCLKKFLCLNKKCG